MTKYISAAELDRLYETPGEGVMKVAIDATCSEGSNVLSATGSVILPDMCFNLSFKLNVNSTGEQGGQKSRETREGFTDALKAVLTCAGLLHPRPDARAWREVTRDKPFVIVADTSAICNGYIHWLCNALWHQRFEVAAMSVVERELAGFADQQDFWKDVQKRTIYRVARAATENPPPNLITSRPALEEKAALMLSKVVTPGQKSPDADVLLVELAREILLSESKQVQPLFVTGDRNASRSAMSAMGVDKTLFIESADLELDKPLYACASYWQPAAGDGCLHILPLSQVIGSLLLLFDSIMLTSDGASYKISRATQGKGVPSDWAHPIYEVESVAGAEARVTTTPELSGKSSEATRQSIANGPRSEPSFAFPVSQGNRLGTKYFVEGLNVLLSGSSLPPVGPKEEIRAETFGSLIQLGAATPEGKPIPDSRLLAAVRKNDWGTVGTLLRDLGGFRKALERFVRGERITSRDEGHLAVARRIGWVIQFSRRDVPRIADNVVESAELLSAVQEIVGARDGAVSLKEIQANLVEFYRISPLLFEQFVMHEGNSLEFPFVLETGGTAITKEKQMVYHFSTDKVEEREIYADNSRFGGERTYRSVRRKSNAESV